MIKIIDNDFANKEQFKEFCKSSSFGTRIYSHFLCYDYEFSFVDFWVQFDDDECCDISAVYCRLDGEFIACFSEKTDFCEASAFLNFQAKSSLTFDSKYSEFLDIEHKEFASGDVLIYKGNDRCLPEFDTFVPALKDYHNLLLICESENFLVPPYLNFLSDTTRRLTRDLCSICGIEVDDTLVSCAMTVSQTDFSVILGAVATHPKYRKCGYAGCVVRKLANSFLHLDSVYIYTTIERNTRFYVGQGFVLCGKWTKYIFGG